jgi:hypothetical protein
MFLLLFFRLIDIFFFGFLRQEIGVIPMMLFSDVLPGGGGTAIAEGNLHYLSIALCSMRAILL